MHTLYCDGEDTPEAMALSAIEKGFTCIGFSGHSYVEFDPDCGMNHDAVRRYMEEIAALRVKYQEQIRICCGVEQDSCSVTSTEAYDYVIGSVHYLPGTDIYFPVDDTPEQFVQGVKDWYRGDYYLAAETYFDAVIQAIAATKADIVGHFDLISKYNEKLHLFDEAHPRYTAAWKKAADVLTAAGKIFEINTGAISRGWRSVPYPNPVMINYLKKKEAKFILSSDSHSRENIGYGFDKISV